LFNRKFVYICKGLVLKNRHFAKLLDVSCQLGRTKSKQIQIRK